MAGKTVGAISVVTFFMVVDVWCKGGKEFSQAVRELRELTEADDTGPLDAAIKAAKAQLKGPAAPKGRKPSVDVEGITRSVLSQYHDEHGEFYTLETYSALPEGSKKKALTAAANAAVAKARAERELLKYAVFPQAAE